MIKRIQSLLLPFSLALCVSSIPYVSKANAETLSDKNLVIAQNQIGAPVGGTTGTGGNSGAGNYEAGDNREDTYDNPSNPMRSTTSGSHRHPLHHRASDSVNPNKPNNTANPAQTYSNPSGAPASGALAPVPGAAGGGPAGTGR